MKNKAPLALMEQLIMLLVFALAAALCLQVFARSGSVSRRCEAQAFAATAVQNVAETVKHHHGDLSALNGGSDTNQALIGYDAQWQETAPENAEYLILVTPEETSLTGLGKASVTARTCAGEELFAVAVCWQEVCHE